METAVAAATGCLLENDLAAWKPKQLVKTERKTN
jgi:hypothetical protein